MAAIEPVLDATANPALPSRVLGARLAGAATGSMLVSLAIVVSSRTVESALGAPLYWPWLLTGLQVVALWAAGRDYWWGWLQGASVQIPWIVYAVVTGQLGFIPGCAISAAVQARNFVRGFHRP